MYCPKCGNEIENGLSYCTSCGATIETAEYSVAGYAEETTSHSGTATATLERTDDFTDYQPPKSKKPHKNNKTVKSVIIAACIVAVVGAGGIICKTKFAPAISRAFMGEQGYAVSLIQRSAANFAADSDNLAGLTANVIPSIFTVPDDNQYISNALYANMCASAAASAIGEDNISITQNVDITPLGDYNSFFDGADSKYIDLINGISDYSLTASVSGNDRGKEIYSGLSYNGTEILDSGLNYTANGKNSYLVFPAMGDEYVSVPLPRQAVTTVDKNEITDMLSSLLDVVTYYCKDAEITYTNGKESVGDISFSGDIVTVTLNQQTISNILGDMSDVISDSDLRSNSILSTVAEFLASEQDYIYYLSDSNCYLDFVTYVNSDGSIAGSKIKYRENHRSDKKSIDYLSLSNGSKYAVYAKINGIKMIDIRADKHSSTSGSAEVRIALSTDDVAILNVEYQNYKTKKLHNISVPTGNYSITIDLPDSVINSLYSMGINADMLNGEPTTLTLDSDNDSYKIDMQIANIAKISAETKLSDNTVAVDKGNSEIEISDFDTKYSDYISALDDPLFSIINGSDNEEIYAGTAEISTDDTDYEF